MNATIIARTPTSFTLQVEVPYNDSMLGFEETLQQRLNEAGVVATAEGLQQFDTDGAPVTVGSAKLTTKGQVQKDYQTPYGVATLARHVYQSPQGGPTYCPLDRAARIVVSSTPRFAKTLSHKYAEFSSPRAQIDLEENEVEEECLKILALHQPVAGDLRRVASVLKINTDLERMGDLAANIAATSNFLHACFERQPEPHDFETMLAFNMVVPPRVRVGLMARPANRGDALELIRCPVLVTHGDKDRILLDALGKYTASAVAAVPAANLHAIRQAAELLRGDAHAS